MRRFRTRPSCARSVIYVEDADGDSHNSLLFQTLIQPSRKEERFESAQEIDHSCTVLSRTFGSRGQKKRNPPRLKPIEDVDEEELLEAQKKEMIRMHEDAANFSLIIEMNGQRVRQIDAYHFEPYDEEKVRQEKENKYQEELQLVESKLKDLRKRKTTYSPPKKMSPTILSSRQNTLRPFSNSTTLRTSSAEKTIFDLQQEAFQRDELHFTALELSHNEELEFTALEAPQTDEFQMECSESDKLQVTALEPILHDGFTALETPQSNKSNTLCKTTQLEELQFTALEITQHDELQYTNLEIPESDELEFAPLEIPQTEELQFTPLECPENDKLQTTALELTQCEKLQLTALESPQRNVLQVTAVPQSDTLQFTVFETTQKDQLQFTTLDPFSECSLPTALDSMLASTRYLEGTMNGTGMTKRRNITQIVPYDGSEGEGKANTKAFYLYDYDGNLEDHLGQVLHVVRQETPIPWSKLGFKKIRKLGEGSYGEVFSTQYKGQNTAVKIVPFNTDAYRYNELVNGENMLEPGELLPEILISQELSALYNPTADNSTPNFIRVLGAHVMKGELPSNILNAWKKYDKERTSENDNPAEYSSPQQLYLALCLAMGGEDLEKFQFETEEQIFSVLIQVAMSLVIAEEMLEFEHRDLHHGNLLLEKYDDDIEYRYQGQNLKVKSHGIRVNIIDFSLSRMSKEKTTLFKDLSNDDELFTMEGQYQYDIYRRMKEATTNDWKQFTPKTNVYWLHYLANQMIIEKKCKKTIKKKRKDELMELFERVLDLDRLRDMFTDKPLEELLAPYVESFDDENVY